MPTTAQVIVEAGFARATGNDPGKLASDGELLNRLNRVFMSLYALAARQRPEEFAATAQMTLAGSPATLAFSAASPALTDVIEIRRLYGVSGTVAAGTKIHLVPEVEAFKTWQIAPVMFRRGLSLVSRGQTGDPVAADVIGLTVLDSPTALTALATNIDSRFPVRHHEILVNDIGLYLDGKDEGRDQGQFNRLMSDQKTRMMAFASEYNLSASAVEQILNDRVPAIPAG